MFDRRETLMQALKCRTTTHYGVECNRCPYGRKLTRGWGCDTIKLHTELMKQLDADAAEIDRLRMEANDYKVKYMTVGGMIR